MQILPAIDFNGGRVVNLRQGQLNQATTYSDDPLAIADLWVSQGARNLHLVDLDGAFAGKPVNQSAIKQIARHHPQLSIQLGGGIRSATIIESYLNAGVNYLIIGTKAVEEPAFVGEMCQQFPGHIMVGLDGLNGLVATRGWKNVTHISVKRLAEMFQADGIASIVYTDIGKDGMMDGINLKATIDLAASVDVNVIASGGVSRIKDIEALCAANRALGTGGHIRGVITGRALYEGTLNLAEAIRLASV